MSQKNNSDLKNYANEEIVMRVSPIGGALRKFEKRAFGWTFYDGIQSNNYKFTKKGIKPRFFKKLTFLSHTPYTENVLFKITEFIQSLFSYLRRFCKYLFIPVIIASVILAYLNVDKQIQIAVIGISCAIYASLYLISIILSLLGIFERKIFHIEEKLERNMEKNGYSYHVFD